MNTFDIILQQVGLFVIYILAAFIPDMSTWSASHFLLVLYMQLVASHEMDKESLGRWHILVAPGF